ncbi:MAG: putative bifunctional diguanylate cyclase/phosphodiesterase, partial [Acidimicrobiales bacterium]
AFMFLLGRDMTSTRDLLFEILYQREQSQDQAQHAQKAAHRDPLTGLLNRAGLEAATAAAAASASTITVMFIDLDHFKSVNDRFGHAAGDELLKEVGERLLRTVRPGDIVARLGGDEFLLVFPDELTEPVRDRLASAVISNLELPFEIGNLEARISASLGITVVAAEAFDLSAVQREADHALYVAKAQGRRRSVHFDKNLRSELDERSEIETELRRTISAGGIDAWAQPIVDLERGSVVAVELLARWERSDGTYCPPSIFVPLAEEIGLIGDLGQQMLEHAGHTLATWRHDEHLAAVAVSVNVSPRQLRDESFVPRLRELFQRRELRPGSLILELTETAELHDLPDIDATLAELVEAGALLALDDFGSGYSSVQHLIGLPIEYVKLDGSLVRDLDHDPRQIALVRSIRDLAATLGRIVVVEGVETEAQARQLADLRFQLAQGFYYSPARPIGEFASAVLPGGDPRTAYRGAVPTVGNQV